MEVYGTSREMYFMILKYISLRPRLPLVPVTMDFNKLLLQKLKNIPPVFPLP